MKEYFIFAIFMFLMKNKQTTAKDIAREFESNQKVMNTIDEMLGKMVNISEL